MKSTLLLAAIVLMLVPTPTQAQVYCDGTARPGCTARPTVVVPVPHARPRVYTDERPRRGCRAGSPDYDKRRCRPAVPRWRY